ncbi:P-loop NTPase [bacterium]|nr:P-loop NTPase [bacterium]
MISHNHTIDQAKGLRKIFDRNELAKKPVITAIAGSKGGVGKSTLALNVAWTLKQEGKKILLMDANFGMGHLEMMMGLDHPITLASVMTKGMQVMDAMNKIDKNLFLIPSGFGEPQFAYLHPVALEGFLIEAEKCARGFDHFIIDTRSNLNEATLQALSMSEKVLVITTPEPVAMAEAYESIKLARKNDSKKAIYVVVNRVKNDAEARDVFLKLQKITQSFLGYGLNYAGFLPQDKKIMECIIAQKTILQLYPDSALSTNLKNIAASLDDNLKVNLKKGWSEFWAGLYKSSSFFKPIRESV